LPPTAASGEAFRIEGLAEVPLCRPSPMQGSATPRRISARHSVSDTDHANVAINAAEFYSYAGEPEMAPG
jgi:hypothetical protein